MDKVKSLITALVIIFIIAIVAAVAIPGFIRQRNYKPSENEIRLLRENDSIAIANGILMKYHYQDSLKIDSISKNISTEKTKIIYFNNNKNEKIRSVDGYNSSGLYRAFANVDPKGFN